MDEAGFAALVDLACHDLRTPLATVTGFSKTILRAGELGDPRYIELIDQAAEEMSVIVERLGLASRIAGGRYDPHLVEANTLELAAASGIPASGEGAAVETDAETVTRSLHALAAAAVRFGGDQAAPQWVIAGRTLELAPAPSTMMKDLGALVALAAFNALGSAEYDGEKLVVRL
jgi:signal transduction histidine kinase